MNAVQQETVATTATSSAVQTSTSACMHSIAAALVAGEKFLGANRTWAPGNDAQHRFVELFPDCRLDIPLVKEIESVADWDVAVVNRFLASKGFSIKLDPINEDTFAAAGVLDLLVEWVKEGEKTQVEANGTRYPAARIKLNESILNVRFFRSNVHSEPIVCLDTKTKDTWVWATMSPRIEGFNLLKRAAELTHQSSIVRGEFGGVVFPMVDLSQENDISWLIGLSTRSDNGTNWRVSQALQQNKLRMNEKGARAQSAAAVAITRGISMPKPDMVIDRPFLVWFTRAGTRVPLFAAWVSYGDWKEPASL